jgi:hypothetical protein
LQLFLVNLVSSRPAKGRLDTAQRPHAMLEQAEPVDDREA